MENSLTKLRVGDEDFLVASMIERCPKIMMVRELLMNALEATQQAEPGDRKVDISGVEINGTRKLRIWNTGPGMNAEELFRMCDIASSIGKEKGLDRNFGMGAKVASLPSNQLGIRYRSCRDGQVHEVMIGKRDGVYGRVPRVDPQTGEVAAVVNATAAAVADGMPVDREWTEVVLLGNHPDQDTTVDPYARDPAMPRNWLPTAIYNKFFEIDEGIELTLSPEVQPHKVGRRLRTMKQRIAKSYARHEAVTLPDGVTIHYLFDPPHPTRENRNASFDDDLIPDTSVCALIHGGEFYDMRRALQWTPDGPSYGISFGARFISILIELSDGFPVRPDAYRQFMRYVGGAQDQVRVQDFASMVRANRPRWLIDLIAGMSPDIDLSRDVSAQLANLLKALGIRRMRPVPRRIPMPETQKPYTPLPQPPAKPELKEASPKAEVPPRPDTPRPPDPGIPEGTPVDMVPDVEIAPELLLLREPKDIAERNLTHRAARYYPETHQLFVNLRYPSVTRQTNLLVAAAPVSVSVTQARATAAAMSEQGMLLRVGRALIFGLGKRDIAMGWSETDKRTAVSSETLTIAADDIYSGHAELLEAFRAQIEETQVAPLTENAA